MAFYFSQKLNKQIRRYLAKHGENITQQQAEEYLHSIADLYCLIAESIGKNQRSPKKEKESGGAAF